MRHAKPEAGSLARVSTKVVSIGDYIPFGLGGTALSLATGIPAIVNIANGYSLLFLALLLPTVLILGILHLCLKNSVSLPNTRMEGDQTINSANALFDQIRGEYTEQLALPIMRKIYVHAQEGAHNYWGECRSSVCRERLLVLAQLIPTTKRASDKSDIQQALDFIEDRRSLEA